MNSTEVTLSLNTGFLVNRFTVPEQWIPFVAEKLAIKRVQFTASLIPPYMPDKVCSRIAVRTKKIADDYGIIIESTFTDAFTRLNHFSHPYQEVRAFWLKFFKRFADISVVLGAQSMGSHFGILTIPDCFNTVIRKERFYQNIDCWRVVAKYAKSAGLKFLTWEPMSIRREYGESINEIKRIQKALSGGYEIPMLLCLDVDHGDISSANPDDVDPYCYLRTFGAHTAQVHLKQSCLDKSGHWPFIAEYNIKGKIVPNKVVEAIKGMRGKVSFVLEFSVRERSSAEKRFISDIKQSIKYWRPYCCK